MKYIILIPAYNPDNKLIKLVKEINNKYITIVVNDGSDKAYNGIFNEVKKYAYVINYSKNEGKGFALKTGFNYIEDVYDKYIVVTMDCDGQHTLKDGIKLCDYVKDNIETLVIGKRKITNKMPLKSRVGNKIIRKILNKYIGTNIYDTQSGLRAFSYKLMKYMQDTPGNGYEYEMNVLLNLNTNNIKYKEVDISTIYFNHNKDSHFKVFRDSYKIYREIIRWHYKNK